MEYFDYGSPFDGDAFECNFCHQRLRILRRTGYAVVVDPANPDRILPYASHTPCPVIQRMDEQMNEEINRQRERDLESRREEMDELMEEVRAGRAVI